LINLVDNGLRYSEKNTGRRTLTLSTGVTEDGQRAYIDVRDQGPGLNDKQRASLFEPFFTTEQQGTGLGLYLARELCEANQARLFLLGSNEQGSCFRITFAHPGKRTLDYTAAPEVTGTDT
jgi:Signal transduction histidine kinase